MTQSLPHPQADSPKKAMEKPDPAPDRDLDALGPLLPQLAPEGEGRDEGAPGALSPRETPICRG